MSTKRTGDRGEAIAARYLEGAGYQIFDRNYRYEHAEIDLVCFQPASDGRGGEIVFVEVKTRTGRGFGAPAEAVTDAKQERIAHAARAYLYERRLEGVPVRFDVIGIVLRPDGPPEIEHYEDAFWSS